MNGGIHHPGLTGIAFRCIVRTLWTIPPKDFFHRDCAFHPPIPLSESEDIIPMNELELFSAVIAIAERGERAALLQRQFAAGPNCDTASISL